jgi:DNA-binding LacI/PurR family transcriptional regulator
MKKRVTIKDVARLSGVTHTTVSRVIRNLPFVRDETRSKVMQALRRLDYQPNYVARGLASKRSHVIALITPELEPFVHPVIRGVTEAVADRDYALMLIPMATWLEEDRSIVFVAENWLVDGILVYNVIYHKTVPAKVRQMQEAGIPVVFINKFLDKPNLFSVGVDNFKGVFKGVEHLVSLGHKRIGLLCGDLTSVDGMERNLAFRQAMKHFNLPVDEKFAAVAYFNAERAQETAAGLLAVRNPPTAIFCCNDMMAVGAIRAARARKLQVPRDLAVVGFDDCDTARLYEIPITTLRTPVEDAGARAFKMMMDILNKPGYRAEQIRYEPELIVRESTVAKSRHS